MANLIQNKKSVARLRINPGALNLQFITSNHYITGNSLLIKIFAILILILLHEKFLQFDWLRAVAFQLNLKYLHVKNYKPFVGSSVSK